ncbi:MAG: hypothetical protein OHK006_13910 [Thermodesulfovibrionales bacterium]
MKAAAVAGSGQAAAGVVGMFEPRAGSAEEKSLIASIFDEIDFLTDPVFDFGEKELLELRRQIGQLKGLVLK